MKRFKYLILMIAVVVMMFGSTLTVFAAGQGSNSTIQKALDENHGVPSNVASSFQTTALLNDALNAGADYEYYSYTNSSGITMYALINKSDVATVASSLTSGSQLTNTSLDILHQQDFSADTEAAMGIMSGFFPIIRVVMGIATVLITAGMTVFSAGDLCYIAFPVIRNKCEDIKTAGGKGTRQDKNTGETKLWFITDDAVYAVRAADTVESGKNPFLIYFGKRSLSYIVLAVLIFIMFTGKITIFADIALKVVSGILNIIKGI